MDDPAWTHRIPLSHLEQWWLQVKCGCGRSAAIPLRRHAMDRSVYRLGQLLTLIRCSTCGVLPETMWLAERADAEAAGGGGGLVRVKL